MFQTYSSAMRETVVNRIVFMTTILCVILALLSVPVTKAGPLPPMNHVEHERRDSVGINGWTRSSRVDAHIELPVRIGFAQKDLERGHDMLMDISEPSSPNYGRHLSAEEVIEMFSPPQNVVDILRLWLQDAGIDLDRVELSANKQWLQFNAKTLELESLLHTRYHKYVHHSGTKTIACDAYYVPKHISHHIDYIKPGIALVGPSSRSQAAQSTISKRAGVPDEKMTFPPGKNCTAVVSPQCIRELYQIDDGILKRQVENSVGVYEDGGSYDQESLNSFFTTFANWIPNGTAPEFAPVDGAPAPGTAPGFANNPEADEDFEAVFPLVYPDRILDLQVDDLYYETHYIRGLTGEFNTMLDAIDGSYCNRTSFGITGDSPVIDPSYPDKHKGGYKGSLQCGVLVPPKVITISAGAYEGLYPTAYQARQCTEFMKLALQGTTVFIASGDNGVVNYYRNSACAPTDNEKFGVGNPLGCPYVTSVGATTISTFGPFEISRETASTSFGSSGGFSNIFLRPSWQDKALRYYFDNHDPKFVYYKTKFQNRVPNTTIGQYNRAGRGIPDIAAIGERYGGYDFHGHPTFQRGTSLSAPLLAGIFTRINNYRLAAGKSTVGFINPVLYANPDMFNDVTEGVSNPYKECVPHRVGFRAVKGWDPVTGLGSPNYKKMLKVFMDMK